MLKTRQHKLLLAAALSFTLISQGEVPRLSDSPSAWIGTSLKAEALSSGGRSSGGSFSRKSSGSQSRSRPSTPSRDRTSTPSRSDSYYRSRDRNRDSTTLYHSGSNTSAPMPGWIGTAIVILLLGGLGLLIFAVTYIVLKQVFFAQKSSQPTSKALRERDNDRVTLSQLQVALLAQAKGVQSALSELSLRIDASTAEGLTELLQEASLVLLRHSEYWSHALSHSESRHIDTAEAAFGKLSMAERSKFSAETLTNVKGKVQQTALISPENESSDYIVVTLLVGTAHDQPLFKTIRSTQALKEALEKLAAIPPDYLMKVEVLWSPQTETDSLTYDELLTEYTEMVQLV